MIDPASSLLSRCRRFPILLARQFVEHRFEVLRFAEVSVDRSEAHIGNIIERAQAFHHHLANGLRGNFALALALKFAHDLGYGLIDALGLDRALAQRDLHRAQELVAVEWHATAVALDDHELAQLHPFEGGEAEIAGKAYPTTADDAAVLRRPRVLHLRVEAAAIRTAHDGPLSDDSR